MKVSSHTWVKKSPSILLFTSRGAPFHLPCCQQAQARASFFSLAPNTGTQQLCSQWLSHHPMSSTKVLSHKWQELLLHCISTHNPVPGSLAGHHCSSQKRGKIHCNLTLCLGHNDPQLPHLAWSPWTILASQTRAQSEPCSLFLLPFVYDFQCTALVTSLQWKERKITMPAAKIILLLITFSVLYLRPIL